MSKFKIKFKLTGLEMEVEGSREDIPAIAQNLAQQLTGLIAPAAALASGATEEAPQNHRNDSGALPLVQEVKRKKRAQRSGTRSAESTDRADIAIDWRHEPNKYGTPKQGWKTADKCLWLLHVVSAETLHKDLSTAAISATFNKHFKQAGMIQVGHINRDLGRLKVKTGGLSTVAEDTTVNPSVWYLTEEGQRRAIELVSEALGRK